MNKPDSDCLDYLNDIINTLETLISRDWYLNDDRLTHAVQGIKFQVEDLKVKVLKRLNKE